MCGGSALKQEAGQGQAGQDGTDLPAWSLGGCLRYPDRHWPDMDCRSRRLHVHPHAAHGRGKDQAFLFPLGEKHVFCVFLMIAIPLSYMLSQGRIRTFDTSCYADWPEYLPIRDGGTAGALLEITPRL